MRLESFPDLSTASKDYIPGIVRCAQDAFGKTMQEKEVIEHLGGFLIVAVDNEDVIAFCVSKTGTFNEVLSLSQVSDMPTVHLVGAAVRSDYQGQGVYKNLNVARLGNAISARIPLIYTRTQNPGVEAGLSATLQNMREQGLIKRFFVTRDKEDGVYGRLLTPNKPSIPPNSPYNELNYDRGDAFHLFG